LLEVEPIFKSSRVRHTKGAGDGFSGEWDFVIGTIGGRNSLRPYDRSRLWFSGGLGFGGVHSGFFVGLKIRFL
jgi:hypothetical protein